MKKIALVLGIFLLTVSLTCCEQTNSPVTVNTDTTDTSTVGSSDPGFGIDGVVKTSFPDKLSSIAGVEVQKDGKIVVAGNLSVKSGGTGTDQRIALVRYNSDGTLDSSFGLNGKVIVENVTAETTALSLQQDGKIVVTGSAFNGTRYDFLIIRYNADGTLDSNFGSGGMVTTPIPYAVNTFDSNGNVITVTEYVHARARCVRLQEDGKIVAGGEIFHYSGKPYLYKAEALAHSVFITMGSSFFYYSDALVLVRYNSDGTIDNGFGNSGIVTGSFATWYNTGRSIAIQPDGRILIAGGKSDGGRWKPLIVRHNSDGSLDTGFGTGGAVIGDVLDDIISSLVIQGDGKIVAESGTLTRYNANGTIDSGFVRITGSIRTGVCGSIVLIQNDGKLLVAGSAASYDMGGNLSCSNSDVALERYQTDGTYDTAFGSDGKVKIDMGQNAVTHAAAFDEYGRIIVAGAAGNYLEKSFTVWRYIQ